MSELIPITGYFGKVHTRGDFVTKGLPHEFSEPWHLWLQETIVAGRSQLGKKWISYYLTSPLYRFLLSPGLCGQNAWLGAMMPSVDRIGRYYPFTVAAPAEFSSEECFQELFELEKTWFESVEQLMLSSLADGFDLELFNRKVSRIVPRQSICTQSSRQSISRKPSTATMALRYALDSSSVLPKPNEWPDAAAVGSYWWTRGSEAVCPSLLVCSGLPAASLAPAMLDGNWQQRGWELK